ncbi:MAG: ABC transporter ATP-binding protein [Leptolyngbyaceae cyanobacterium RM2_2_4]|nr:ABC transporter ATP-binding protein [Leptolyngbyaceae cyanobacterium SM1_4_3]NJL55450.1 ABC transporter ATP-binding protein [bacterium]NJO48803.1 ABC transporter ATP-binding protein [Leptolyngbyaceae cyanobacterium RM2_2_4]
MLLHTEHLVGGYRDHPVIHDLHLTLQPGEWLSLIGANGSGKSTLLKLLNRLLIPQQGVVWLDGKAIHSLPAQIVAQRLAWLPQQSIAPEGLTVRQLVSLGRTPYQPWWQWELNADDRDQVETAMAQVQVQQFSDRPVEQLSGGERQRAFLALALAQAPKVLLLDEPTTYLDIHYQLELLELLRRLNREQNLTIITVLHDINLAARYSDRLALLRHGCLWAIGTPVDTLTLENLRQVFDIEAAILQTPVGLQVCPLTPASI